MLLEALSQNETYKIRLNKLIEQIFKSFQLKFYQKRINIDKVLMIFSICFQIRDFLKFSILIKTEKSTSQARFSQVQRNKLLRTNKINREQIKILLSKISSYLVKYSFYNSFFHLAQLLLKKLHQMKKSYYKMNIQPNNLKFQKQNLNVSVM